MTTAAGIEVYDHVHSSEDEEGLERENGQAHGICVDNACGIGQLCCFDSSDRNWVGGGVGGGAACA